MSFRVRMLEAAATHARRLITEGPEAVAAEKAARLAEAKALHEAERRAAVPAHLERCGLQAADARKVAVGLSPDWGVVAGGVSALRAARQWWREGKPLLLLFGATGTGKTMAVGELLARVRLDYVHPDYGPTWAWPSTLSESAIYGLAGDLAQLPFRDDKGKERDRLMRCRLLVVDELGLEVLHDPWLSLLESLVVRRHAAGLRTALASNVGGQDFRARYGARIARRLNEDGVAVSLGTETLSGVQP